MKHQFIDAHRHRHDVRTLCHVLGVSTSGYYAACGRPPSARGQRQASLTARIRTIHTESRDTYGAPRVHVELAAQQIPCCKNTVARLMRQAEIVPKTVRRFRVGVKLLAVRRLLRQLRADLESALMRSGFRFRISQ
jgi:putative transposase